MRQIDIRGLTFPEIDVLVTLPIVGTNLSTSKPTVLPTKEDKLLVVPKVVSQALWKVMTFSNQYIWNWHVG